MNERVAEAKVKVEEIKARVRALNAEISQHNSRVRSCPGYWQRKKDLARYLQETIAALGKAKIELAQLSGTGKGKGKPRDKLLAKAYWLLSKLDESGIDLGEEGEKLLSSIEFHLPVERLVAQESAG